MIRDQNHLNFKIMKRIINVFFVVIFILIVALFSIRSWTKRNSPFEQIEASKGDLTIKVSYCRPLMNKRKIFGDLAPYNTVWRTGANEATVLHVSKSCTFANQKVKAGDYSLWTIPNKNEWTIILNKEIGQWGTNYDSDKDYIRFKVLSVAKKLPTEQLTINLTENSKGINFDLNWENTNVAFLIK